MKVLDSARLVIYRVNKKGLEIFLVNNEEKGQWCCPQCAIPDSENDLRHQDNVIELDPVDDVNGPIQALAIESDWHEIPSIRGIIKEDVRIVKHQIKQHFPDLEKGTYFAVKEAVKKVMPEEYAMLKELKDIVLDKNMVKSI